MAAGTIHAAIKLDQPGRVHYGSREPVAGNVVLTFRPSINGKEQHVSEFFGPMKIHVSLHGRLKTKIRVSRGNSSSTYRGRVPVFKKDTVIFNDSAKIAAGETWLVPFESSFPTAFEYDIDSHWEKESRFDCSQGHQLPPSFASSYYGFKTHYDSFIEYRVGVTIYVPHVPVNIVRPEREQEPLVHYEQPSLPRTEDRPSGFRQNLKAKLSDDYYPQYIFNWSLIAPKEVYLGQPIACEVAIRPREEECTAIIVPDIYLKSMTVSLIGNTVVRAEKQFITTPDADHDEVIKSLKGILDDAGPFSKAGDWKKTINTPPLHESIASSFRTVNISQTHAMRLNFIFGTAGKSFPVETKFQLTILPPLAEAVTVPSASTAMVGPSSRAMDMQPIDEALPRYEDDLPEYDEAVEGSPPAPPPKRTESVPAGADLRPT